jgi:hypothetical protein
MLLSNMALFGFLHRKDKPFRQQLLEARQSIERQLEILRAGPQWGRGPDNRSAVAALKRELAEIDETLANAKDDDD